MDSIYDKIKFLVRYLNECTKAYDEGHPKITGKNVGIFGPDQMWARVSTNCLESVIQANTPFIPDIKYLYNDPIAIFFIGHNDQAGMNWFKNNGYSFDKDHKTYINMISNVVQQLPSKRYIVITTVCKKTRSDEIEKMCKDTFGNNYLNMHQLLEQYGLSTAVKLNIMSEADSLNTTWDNTKTGLMYDSSHPKSDGSKVFAYFIREKLIELGYIQGERDLDIIF